MDHPIIGSVLAVAIRTSQRGPMKEVPAATAKVDGGLDTDIPVSRARGITFLSANQWRQVNKELAVELPWHTRRANVLIDSDSLADLIGKSVRVGPVLLKITGETRPCELMDSLHQGLRTALTPDCRGGVHGRVIEGGTIRVGDQMVVDAPPL